MAITFPITLPSAPGPVRFELSPRAVVATLESPFTLEEQVFEHQGQAWALTFELPPMLRATAEPWLAALMSLNGKRGTFLIGDPIAKSALGSVAGAPVVDGAGQTGKELNTRGWTASAGGVLLAGDYFQVGSGGTTRFYKALKDVSADGSGNATIDIWPRLRESPVDGDPLVTASPKGVFRLAQNALPWDVDRNGVYVVAFGAVEAL